MGASHIIQELQRQQFGSTIIEPVMLLGDEHVWSSRVCFVGQMAPTSALTIVRASMVLAACEFSHAIAIVVLRSMGLSSQHSALTVLGQQA